MTVQLATASDTNTATITAHLARALSETSVVTAKAQTYHWNVIGMAFGPLHDLFQRIYEDHFEAQDMLAERMRALGDKVDGRLQARLKESRIDECAGNGSGHDMVKAMAADQKTLSATLLTLARQAERQEDDVTNDLAIERAQIHDNFAWMLDAHLAE